MLNESFTRISLIQHISDDSKSTSFFFNIFPISRLSFIYTKLQFKTTIIDKNENREIQEKYEMLKSLSISQIDKYKVNKFSNYDNLY